MLNLIAFLNGENNEILSELNLNQNEIAIVKFMLKNLLMQNDSQNVAYTLKSVFGENLDSFNHLLYLDEILGLIDKDILKISMSNRAKIDLLNDVTFLTCDISLSSNFTDFLANGSKKSENSDESYKNIKEYLDDIFELIRLKIREKMMFFDQNAKALHIQIELFEKQIQAKTHNANFDNEIENIFKSYKLNENEKFLFLILLSEEFNPNKSLNVRNPDFLAGILGHKISGHMKNIYFDELVSLNEKGLVDINGSGDFMDSDEFFNDEISIYLNSDIVAKINNSIIKKANKKSNKIMFENSIKESKIFELLSPEQGIDEVILSPKIKEIFDTILTRLDKKITDKLKAWGIKNPNSVGKKMIFYGPPGTGKTLSALSLAKSLKKDIISFDCSKILSKWVGESEQNVRKIFDSYNEICQKSKNEPILLLNEADQFLSTRISESSGSADKMHNQMQNIFLEQIERFTGILIATTNFMESFDTAFSRRFDYKIEFKKPNFDERVLLWNKFLPKNAKFEKDFDINELAKFELTGAQIELVVKNTAFKKVSLGEDEFGLEDFAKEAKNEIEGSFDKEKIVGLI